jgi:phosphate-selective porin OprO/OprP
MSIVSVEIVKKAWAALSAIAILSGTPVSAADAPETPPRVSANKDGFVIQSDDGAFRLRISGYAQGDGRFYLDDEDDLGTSTFLLRRVRPIVSGTLGRIFEFNITPDFGGGTPALQDAYLDARPSAKLRLRVGKFKAPVGLERLQSATALFFVERGFTSVLTPNREVGVQVHGELGGGVAAYALGVFDGAPDGGSVDVDSNDAKDVAGRLFLQPFRKSASPSLQGIGVGIAATTGEQEGALPSFRSPGQLTIFSYATGVAADGTRTRFVPQASYAAGPLRLLGEYVRSSQDVRRGSDAFRVSNEAWQVAATFLLTGEAAVGGVVSPRRPFGEDKGRGAFEVAARYTELDVDDAVFTHGLADRARSARKARAVAFGLNWYATKNVKYVANYERTQFDGGRAGGDRKTENALLFRAQLAF